MDVNFLSKLHVEQLSFVVINDSDHYCNIILVYSGEMGSGKSSLVNLILGKQLMPTSDLRCTAAIVEISYGPSPLAIAHYRDDSSGRARRPTLVSF